MSSSAPLFFLFWHELMYIVCFVDVQSLHMSACMHNPVELRIGQGISSLVAPRAYSLDAGTLADLETCC